VWPIAIIRPISADRNKIDLCDDVIARHWIKSLRALREEIAAAIEKVGPNADTVRKEIAREKIDESEAQAAAAK
jgi:hypothetical protein